MLVNSEDPDQTARIHRLIWAFAVGICLKTHFCPYNVGCPGPTFRRSLETQMEAQKKKDTSKSANKRQQHNFVVTLNALKVDPILFDSNRVIIRDIFFHVLGDQPWLICDST